MTRQRTSSVVRPEATPSGSRTGRPRSRVAPGDRRTALVEAAIRILQRDEAVANWVAAVTDEAGVAKGTFYTYFGSWEEMLGAVRERLVAACGAPIGQALVAPSPVDYWVVLADQLDRFVDMSLAFRRHHALIFHAAAPGPVREGPALLARLLARGIADGALATVDAEAAASLLYATVHAAADAVLAGADRGRWCTATLALTRGYLSRCEDRTPDAAPGMRAQP